MDILEKNQSFHLRLSFAITTTRNWQVLGYQLEVGSALDTMPYFFMFSFSEQLAAWCICILLALPHCLSTSALSLPFCVLFLLSRKLKLASKISWMDEATRTSCHTFPEWTSVLSPTLRTLSERDLWCWFWHTVLLAPTICFSLLYSSNIMLQSFLWLQ